MRFWWNSVGQDIRFAARQMWRAPGFTLTVVGVLALGIGATSAMFTVLNATVLRSLPYRAPESLVTAESMNAKGEAEWTNLPDIEQWQGRAKTLEGIVFYSQSDGGIDAGAGEQDVSKTAVSANLFSVLGVGPAMGRGFRVEEQIPGAGAVTVLSDGVWRGMFHGAPDILGKVVRIDDVPVTVVGVMRAGFSFPVDDKTPQVWVPVTPAGKDRQRGFGGASYKVIGRMRAGATEADATGELSGIQRDNSKLYGPDAVEDLTPSRVRVTGYRRGLSEHQRPALLALMGAVGIVWLIACANVANLMLARGTARRREMAVRGALGASGWRLARQTMLESLLLSVAGAGLGVGLAWATLQGFRHALEATLFTPVPVVPDARVLLALLGMSVVSAMLFGIAPALLAARVPLDQTLRAGSAQAGTGRAQHRVQRGLVVAEVGLSLAMLVACGLLLRTVFALRHIPLGFRTDHVYVLTPKLPGYKYRGIDANDVVYKPLLERVRAMHGVEAAAITTVMPLSNGFQVTLNLNTSKFGDDGKRTDRSISATLKAAGPELQKVLGLEMVKGRYFNKQDTQNSAPVMVVNEAFAKAYEESTGPIEKFTFGDEGRRARVIGVVKDFHQIGIVAPALPELDLCAPQIRATDNFYQPTLGVRVELALRANRDAPSLLPDLNRVMREVNPDLRASDVRTMDQVVEDSMASQLLAAHLLEALGLLALGVALAGLYSLLAYLVSLRMRELGLRMALGAARGDILALVMRQAGWMLGWGVALGVAVSLATTRLLEHFLFGVKARDAVTIVAAAALMAAVGAVAAYLPARRAAAVEPMEALRAE